MKPAPPAPAPITDIFVPAREFRDPDWDAAEREKMWPKVWQMACRESELTAPGAYVNYEILEEDFANLEAVNLGMKSRGFSGAFLNPHQEGTIGNFHRVLRGYIDGE